MNFHESLRGVGPETSNCRFDFRSHLDRD